MSDESEDIDLSENDEVEDIDQVEDIEIVDPVESDEDTTDWKAEAMKLKAINARLSRKAKPQKQETVQQTNAPDPDELRLIAKGLSDEEIDKAKVIAKGNDISLLKAIEDDLFITFQNDLKDKQRKAKAKLGASSGSDTVEDKGVKPDMTPEDHKALWKEAQGR